MSKEREHYDYSGATPIVPTKHIVDYYWIKNKSGLNMHKIPAQYEYEFQQSMIQASIEQIRHYMRVMDRETKVRAMKTIKKLEGLCQY